MAQWVEDSLAEFLVPEGEHINEELDEEECREHDLGCLPNTQTHIRYGHIYTCIDNVRQLNMCMNMFIDV